MRLKDNEMIKYKILTYDVWGNLSNGWEVNDVYSTGIEIALPDDFNTKELRRAFYDSGFCNRGIFNAKISIDGEWGYSMYVNLEGSRYCGKPFCELRPVTEED